MQCVQIFRLLIIQRENEVKPQIASSSWTPSGRKLGPRSGRWARRAWTPPAPYLSDQPLDVDELLHTLGIYEHQRKLPNQLSGGQQQRCAIGRAIVKNPDILLCDEPTGALDYNTSKEILRLIETLNQKYGNTIVMVTHNDAIKDMADRVVKLRDGMIRKNYRNEHKVSADDLDW